MFKGFERFKRPLLILSLPYLLIILALSMRIDYRIYAPGGLNPVGNFIEFEDAYESDTPLATTYIMNVEEPTPFQTLVGKLSPTLTLSELPEYREGISDSVNYESGQVAKNTSVDLALINAYEALGFTITYETEHIVSLYYDYMDADNLAIGDIVLSVNGSDDVLAGFDDVACGEEAHLEVRKEDGEVEAASVKKQARDDDCKFGLRISTYYRITEAEVPYTLKESPIGGPSGGLMQTLYIYNALSEEDITKDRMIAGTGTIRIDGSVGAIGGVREKVFTAHKEGVDIFFVPTGSNHEDAMAALNSLNRSSMEIVAVDTFEDALEYLEGVRT
ncbi:MAG: S16 family serine protease [Bacillota bacterium]